MQEIQASFLCPCSYAPLGDGGHISGEFFGLLLGVCLSPTPSLQPVFETSDKTVQKHRENPYLAEPSELRTGTEPDRGHPDQF